jgi:hypothetical protein
LQRLRHGLPADEEREPRKPGGQSVDYTGQTQEAEWQEKPGRQGVFHNHERRKRRQHNGNSNADSLKISTPSLHVRRPIHLQTRRWKIRSKPHLRHQKERRNQNTQNTRTNIRKPIRSSKILRKISKKKTNGIRI